MEPSNLVGTHLFQSHTFALTLALKLYRTVYTRTHPDPQTTFIGAPQKPPWKYTLCTVTTVVRLGLLMVPSNPIQGQATCHIAIAAMHLTSLVHATVRL
jgi:hypothetical protein